MTTIDTEWTSLKSEYGDGLAGWFKHTKEEGEYYIDIYKFWIEPFDSHISLTGENLVYGIFHHCLDKDIFENFNGRIDIKSLRTISLYCEDAPSFQVSGYLKDEADRSDKNSQIIESIKKLPRYFTLLKEVIAGKMEPKEAEIISSGVLSAKIL